MIKTERRRQPARAIAALAALAALSSACTPEVQPAADPNRASATPTATVPATPAPSLAVRPPTGIDYTAMKRRLTREVENGPGSLNQVRAVLVSVDGSTTLSWYQHRKPTEQAHVFSVTKSVVSILVGIAVDEGRLRLDQTLAQLLPDHVSVMTPAQQAITLKQLLTMTAGVSVDDGGMNLEAEDPVKSILAFGMTSDPGTRFGYSDGSAHLVATVLRRVIDRPILDYAREKLFDPLGIDTHPAWEGSDLTTKNGFDDAGFAWLIDSTGVHSGGYGLRLTAPDLVKIGQLYLDGGRWKGRQLVSESWVTESTSNQLTAEQGKGGDQYGYFWWPINEPESPGYLAAGAWYQRIFVIPSRRLVIVVTADRSDYAESVITTDFDPVLAETVIEPLLR